MCAGEPSEGPGEDAAAIGRLLVADETADVIPFERNRTARMAKGAVVHALSSADNSA